MILNYSNLNRKTIKNNLDKIKSFYDKKVLSEESLEELLNSDRNELFENIRDASLIGDKTKLNNLLSNFAFSNEDAYLYLNMINYRLIKLLEIHKTNESFDDFNVTITKMRPPIFWKDKPMFLKLLQKWDKQSTLEALTYLGQIEEKLKKNSSLNGLTIVKNSILNICTNSWTYF
jgi:DNA polymerase III delta subunit